MMTSPNAALRLALTMLLAMAVTFGLATGCESADAGASGPAAESEASAAPVSAVPAVAEASGSTAQGFQNVILLIGDGMGSEHVALGRMVKGRPLVFEQWPVSAMLATAPHATHDLAITDSAAAATAIATGVRTINGRISICPEGRRLPTLMQQFQRNGARVGLVSNKSVTDATPAAFAAHANSRRQEAAIASQMIAARPDVLLGGGWSYIGMALGAVNGQPAVKAAAEAGYHLVRSVDQLAAFDPAKAERLLGIFSALHMTYMVDRFADTSEPTLAEMSSAALALLGRDQRPFFLMIEGAKIDTAGHENDPWRLAGEMLAFDEAVAAVVQWLDKNEAWDRTLVIVTADHETGGLKLNRDAQGGTTAEDLARQTTWSTGGHTITPVPLFARGPGSEAAKAARHLTDLYTIISRSTVLGGAGEIIQVDDVQDAPAQDESPKDNVLPAVLKPAA